jgi:hypothetical protein
MKGKQVSEPTQPQTLDEYKKAQHAEWSQYRATEAIDIGGVRAFNEGDPVPASHVERGVVSESVVKKVAKTEAAQTQTADHTPTEKKG